MDPIEKFVNTATRQFTDRQKPRALFKENVQHLKKTTLISFYGIGGIGKTRLLSYLKNKAPQHDQNTLCISVDFHESQFRNIGEFLNTLKFQLLKEAKIEFYAFDLAYAIYWAHTQPGEIPMRKAKTLLPEDHILYDIVDNLDGIPYANLIPIAINLMSKIPAQTKKTIWWKSTGNTLAAQISKIHDIQALSDVLLDLWVNDVIRHFKNSERKLIFFFDSFESVDLNRLPRIKVLTKKFSELPVLFIIGSRDKLNWASCDNLIVDEHIIGELSEEDIRSFLASCQIHCRGEQCHCQKFDQLKHSCTDTHEKIIQKIIHVSNGIPIYLDLMVDTYHSVNKTQLPQPHHFTDNRNEIVPLLLKHFNEVDFAFLELLSFPNYWNYDVLKLLTKEFNPGINLSKVTRFYEYSFIHDESSKHITMQDFVRHWLQQQLQQNSHSREFYADVHTTLHNFYVEKFQEIQNYELFYEASYHGLEGLSQDSFEHWLKEALDTLLNRGYIEGIAEYLQQLLLTKRLSTTAQAYFHTLLFRCYYQYGQYAEIIEQTNEAINQTNEANRADLRAKIQYTVGASYYAMSEYEQAIKYFKLASTLTDNPLQAIDAHMKIGKISVTISDFKAARNEYLQASKLINGLLQTNNDDPELNCLAGQCYEKLGELIEYSGLHSEQLRLYKQSIHYLNKAITHEQHPHYLQHLTLLGFSMKRLAEAYEMQNGDAIGTFNKAITIYEQVLDVMPQSIDTLEKLGHACADLMRVTRQEKKHEAFQTAFEKAELAFTTVIKLAPNQGSSLNRLSSIHLEMAKYYMDKFEYSHAKLYLDQAIYYYKETISFASNYAYAPARKKAIDEVLLRFEKEGKA